MLKKAARPSDDNRLSNVTLASICHPCYASSVSGFEYVNHRSMAAYAVCGAGTASVFCDRKSAEVLNLLPFA